MNFTKKYFRIYWLQIFLSVLTYGFVGFVYLHFFKYQASLFHIMFAEGLYCMTSILVILARSSVCYRRDIMIGFALMAVSFIPVFFPFSVSLMYLFVILFGVGTTVFFNAYNTLFFRTIKSNGRMWGITVYWALGGITAVVAPLIGATIFTNFGFYAFLAVAIIIAAIAISLSKYIPDGKFHYGIFQLFKSLKGIRTINMLDGALHRIYLVAFTLFALFFIQKEKNYGMFLSVMSLAAVCISLVNAKISDRSQKRFSFIVGFSLLAAALTVGFYFINTFTWFLIFALALRSVIVMLEPFRSNIVQDHCEFTPINWIAREMLLNIGRSLILLIITALIYLDLFRWAFILFAILFLVFPCLVWHKKIYR